MAGWDRPQEDEFALALLGQPSPYERIAFPERAGAGDAALDLRGLPPRVIRAWGRAFCRLVRALTLANGGRRLILKSPPHTARIPILLGLFPEARFVHVVRDPYAVYSSTLHLWRVLFASQGLQRSSWAGLPEYILDTFSRMYRALEDAHDLVPRGRLHELRYEDLVQNPVAQLEMIYRELDLGDFEPARQSVAKYLAEVKGHEAGTHVLTAEEFRDKRPLGSLLSPVRLSHASGVIFVEPAIQPRSSPSYRSLLGCFATSSARNRASDSIVEAALERVLAKAIAEPLFQVGRQGDERDRVQTVAGQRRPNIDLAGRNPRQVTDARDDPGLDRLDRWARVYRSFHRCNPPPSYWIRQLDRRTLPLDVFGMLPCRTRTTS